MCVGAVGIVLVALEFAFAVGAVVSFEDTKTMGPTIAVWIEVGDPGGSVEWYSAGALLVGSGKWCWGWRGSRYNGRRSVLHAVDESGIGVEGLL